MPNGWVSPTGFIDPGNMWRDETKAYDEDTDSPAINDIPTKQWSSYLELTHAALSCDKVQFWAYYDARYITQISVDVYYDGAWHNIYEGSFADREWVEKTIPAGTKSVTAARVKFYNNHTAVYNAFLFEFDFWEVTAWITPTSHNDPDDKWFNPTYAYDEDLETYTYGLANYYLELIHAALNCSKVRYYWLGDEAGDAIDCLIDVEYGAAWHNIHDGVAGGAEAWQEFEIGSIQSVTKCRVKSKFGEGSCYFNEFDFWELAVVTHEWTGSDGIAIGEALIKTPMKMLVDGIQFSDVTIKEFYKVLTDPIAFTDTLVSVYTHVRTFVDGIAFTDIVTRFFERVFSDGIAFRDILYKWRWLVPTRLRQPTRTLTPTRTLKPKG